MNAMNTIVKDADIMGCSEEAVFVAIEAGFMDSKRLDAERIFSLSSWLTGVKRHAVAA